MICPVCGHYNRCVVCGGFCERCGADPMEFNAYVVGFSKKVVDLINEESDSLPSHTTTAANPERL